MGAVSNITTSAATAFQPLSADVKAAINNSASTRATFGTIPASFLSEVSSPAERAKVDAQRRADIASAYQTVLGRAASDAEVDGWFKSSSDIAGIKKLMQTSEEYAIKNPTSAQAAETYKNYASQYFDQVAYKLSGTSQKTTLDNLGKAMLGAGVKVDALQGYLDAGKNATATKVRDEIKSNINDYLTYEAKSKDFGGIGKADQDRAKLALDRIQQLAPFVNTVKPGGLDVQGLINQQQQVVNSQPLNAQAALQIALQNNKWDQKYPLFFLNSTPAAKVGNYTVVAVPDQLAKYYGKYAVIQKKLLPGSPADRPSLIKQYFSSPTQLKETYLDYRTGSDSGAYITYNAAGKQTSAKGYDDSESWKSVAAPLVAIAGAFALGPLGATLGGALGVGVTAGTILAAGALAATTAVVGGAEGKEIGDAFFKGAVTAGVSQGASQLLSQSGAASYLKDLNKSITDLTGSATAGKAITDGLTNASKAGIAALVTGQDPLAAATTAGISTVASSTVSQTIGGDLPKPIVDTIAKVAGAAATGANQDQLASVAVNSLIGSAGKAIYSEITKPPVTDTGDEAARLLARYPAPETPTTTADITKTLTGAGLTEQGVADLIDTIKQTYPPVQVASTEPTAGLPEATGSAPLQVSIGGAPIYAESKEAKDFQAPAGTRLMSVSEEAKQTPGAYYDEELNAWLVPTQAAPVEPSPSIDETYKSILDTILGPTVNPAPQPGQEAPQTPSIADIISGAYTAPSTPTVPSAETQIPASSTLPIDQTYKDILSVIGQPATQQTTEPTTQPSILDLIASIGTTPSTEGGSQIGGVSTPSQSILDVIEPPGGAPVTGNEAIGGGVASGSSQDILDQLNNAGLEEVPISLPSLGGAAGETSPWTTGSTGLNVLPGEDEQTPADTGLTEPEDTTATAPPSGTSPGTTSGTTTGTTAGSGTAPVTPPPSTTPTTNPAQSGLSSSDLMALLALFGQGGQSAPAPTAFYANIKPVDLNRLFMTPGLYDEQSQDIFSALR